LNQLAVTAGSSKKKRKKEGVLGRSLSQHGMLELGRGKKIVLPFSTPRAREARGGGEKRPSIVWPPAMPDWGAPLEGGKKRGTSLRTYSIRCREKEEKNESASFVLILHRPGGKRKRRNLSPAHRSYDSGVEGERTARRQAAIRGVGPLERKRRKSTTSRHFRYQLA